MPVVWCERPGACRAIGLRAGLGMTGLGAGCIATGTIGLFTGVGFIVGVVTGLGVITGIGVITGVGVITGGLVGVVGGLIGGP